MHFVVIAAQRTGSSHLISLLGGHPDLLANGNVFDARKEKALYVFWPKGGMTKELKRELTTLRRTDPDAFLERIFCTTFGRKHVGFKIFQDENNDMLDKLIANPDVKKIVLYRRNVLARYSSTVIARKTKKYSRKAWRGDVPEAPKVAFDEALFLRYQRKYVKFYEKIVSKLNATGQAFYFVNYEDINDPLLTKNLVNFIGGDGT